GEQTIESVSNWISDLFSKWCSVQSKEVNFIQLRRCKWYYDMKLHFFPGIVKQIIILYFKMHSTVSCLKSKDEAIEYYLHNEMNELLAAGEPVRKNFPSLVELIATKSKERSPPLVLRSELLEWVAEIFPDQTPE